MDAYRGWKSSGAERRAEIILQLEKSSLIHSIDVGNEGSAFIEILGGRLADTGNNYRVLLVGATLMTPCESRSGRNKNRVRMFRSDKLTPATEEKWDRVKIVCNQPFNKDLFGIAFIKLHSPPEAPNPATEITAADVNRFKTFLVKSVDDGPKLTPGSWFRKRKDLVSPSKDKVEMRLAHAKAEAKLLLASLKEKTPTKRKPTVNMGEAQAKKPASKSPAATASSTIACRLLPEPRSMLETHKAQMPLEHKTDSKEIPLEKVMSGVVFVLSGFQNPLRGDLRDKAIEMGAIYRSDWNQGCTHLICAYSNTPKFQQARNSKGKIVSKNWIVDCHRKKSALPWSQYKLKGRDDDNDNSSNNQTVVDSRSPIDSTMVRPTASKVQEPIRAVDSEDEYGGSTDVDSIGPADDVDSSVTEIHSDSDTEDEIKSVLKKKNNEDHGDKIVDTSGLHMPELPNFFNENKFLLYGDFDDELRRRLVRYVAAFNGELEDYMSDKVTYVITKSEWNDEFDAGNLPANITTKTGFTKSRAT